VLVQASTVRRDGACRNGVTIDQCEECRRIFLDRGELDQLLDAAHASARTGDHRDERRDDRHHHGHDHHHDHDDDDRGRGRRRNRMSMITDMLGGGE
jgi:Zn-finger nucleic acid-binding protein